MKSESSIWTFLRNPFSNFGDGFETNREIGPKISLGKIGLEFFGRLKFEVDSGSEFFYRPKITVNFCCNFPDE